MFRLDEVGNAQRESHERPELEQHYRPIGIGAVAAALSVTGEKSERAKQNTGAGNSDEADLERRPLAA